jgi:mono/diheme cytochrome c family protein
MESRWVLGGGVGGLAAATLFLLPGGLLAREPVLLRGDVDRNGVVEITDAVDILNYLFLGGSAPPCTALADISGDHTLDLTDPIALLTYLFLGGSVPSLLKPDEVGECKGLDRASVLRGMAVYQESDRPQNRFATPFSCATCHEVIPDAEAPVLRSGHTLYDALRRPTFKDGHFTKFIDAANVCRLDWMATTTFQETEQSYQDLVGYLEMVSPLEARPAVDYEIDCLPRTGPVEDQADGLAGCKLFNRSCAVCHGQGGVGSDLGVSLVDLFVPTLDDPDYLRKRIRTSGPSTADRPGVVYPCLMGQATMPFWTRDKLTDAEVEDLAAFIKLAREAAAAGDPTFDCSEAAPPPQGKPLRRGTLRTLQHGVSGLVEELDTRQIRISQFNFDSGGALVKVWLYKEGEIGGGAAIGPDLRRATPYVDETVLVDIPAAITPDLYDSVLVGCELFAVDFGDTKLSAVP